MTLAQFVPRMYALALFIADVIFAAHAGLMFGNILKQAQQFGLHTKFIAPDEAEDSTVIKVAGPAADGLIMLSPMADDGSTSYQSFRSRFLSKFKNEPTTLSANSYDATILLSETLKACNSDAQCVKSRLCSTQEYPGVSGIFSIQPDGGTKKPFKVRTVSNGKFVDAN